MEAKVSGSCGGSEHFMTACSCDTAESASSWTILMSTDASREYEVLWASGDDESRCERLTPIIFLGVCLLG